MARIRRVEISHFRSIKHLLWHPSEGLNCLVGPGDSGKSSVLDALDLCLGVRRTAQFSDTDFYRLNVAHPILIELTVGDLPERVLNLDAYGDFLRGYNAATKQIEDEPGAGQETVITFRLTVGSDLEPVWRLHSERAEANQIERGLGWKDRIALSVARIGNYSSANLSWTRSSVLNRLSEDAPELGLELAKAARAARSSFGSAASDQMKEPLSVVTRTAAELGIPIGKTALALLDAHAVSVTDGAIALHSEDGVPLRALGTGSSRLLVAGLQRAVAEHSSIVLVDEVEFGLEPHRLIRLLNSLGAKDPGLPLQCFMTTHSPVAVRELSGDQIFVVRGGDEHRVDVAGTHDDIQGTLRTAPEVFLARSIVVCEGASEVGFGRGMEQHWVAKDKVSFFALGGAFVDVRGSNPERPFNRGKALLELGYRVFVLADSDKPVDPNVVAEFHAAGGEAVVWRDKNALEHELFTALPDVAVKAMLEYALVFMGSQSINDSLRAAGGQHFTLAKALAAAEKNALTSQDRALLGSAAHKGGWYKDITRYEHVARVIVAPHLDGCDEVFLKSIQKFRRWCINE